MEVKCNSQDLTLRNRASDELTTARHQIAAYLPLRPKTCAGASGKPSHKLVNSRTGGARGGECNA